MSLIDNFQDLVAQVPDLVQPLILALAGAVPFIEGEGAAAIGIVGGIHPVIAVIAGVVGNFLCVAILVLLSSGARTAVVTRHRESVRAREAVAVGGGVMQQFLDRVHNLPAAAVANGDIDVQPLGTAGAGTQCIQLFGEVRIGHQQKMPTFDSFFGGICKFSLTLLGEKIAYDG